MGDQSSKALTVLTLVLLTSLAKGKTNHDANLESLYPAYQLIKNIINGDPKSMFKLNQAFLPAMNYRYWQVDGVEIIPIHVHISFYDDTVQEQAPLIGNMIEEELPMNHTPVRWKFMWTNSLLMSLIPGDILLAMDSIVLVVLYSEIVKSYHLRMINLNLQINRSYLLCNFTLDDLQQALALFLSKVRQNQHLTQSYYPILLYVYNTQSKDEMFSEREPKYQGYISMWYTYYHHDSYFSKLVTGIGRSHITSILTCLWITFGVLNLSLPIFSITRRKQILQWLKTINATANVRFFRAIVVCVTIFNTMYIPIMLTIHVKGYPNVLWCYLSTSTDACRIPPTSTAYNYVFGILTTKLAILPFVLLTELAIAVYVAKQLSTPKRFTLFMWMFAIWQLLVFAQIIVGLVSIPLLVLTFISPIYILLSTGGIVLIFIMITFILSTIPLPNSCNVFQLKGIFKSACSTVEILAVALLILSVFTTYFVIVKDGVNMTGVKGYVISFIPTVPISIFIWLIKKKYLRKRLQKTRPQLIRKRDDLFIEEEMTGLLSTPVDTENSNSS